MGQRTHADITNIQYLLPNFLKAKKDCEKLNFIRESEYTDMLYMGRFLNEFSHHLFFTHGNFCDISYVYLASMN